jgi:hypothetical protein
MDDLSKSVQRIIDSAQAIKNLIREKEQDSTVGSLADVMIENHLLTIRTNSSYIEETISVKG